MVHSNWKRGNRYKLNYRNSSAEYKENNVFTERVTEHWARLSREEAESLALGDI